MQRPARKDNQAHEKTRQQGEPAATHNGNKTQKL